MTKYKDFSRSKVICFDIETKDPDLKSKGPAIRRDGYILGYSLSDETGFAEYYNVRHPDCTDNETDKNINYLKEVMLLDIPKLGTNILYDLDWIQNFLNLKINGKLWDILVAEALINENQFKYNLDFMAEKYLSLSKVKTKIDTFCENHNLKGDPRQWLWQMNYMDVKDYAIGDVQLPIKIFQIQWKIMDNENLLPLFHMEMDLYPMLIHMRKNGVLIDMKKLNIVENEFCDKLIEYENQLENLVGFEINYRANQSIGKACDKFGIGYPLTVKAKIPSFTKQWLENNENKHEIFHLILECRKYYNMVSKFLNSQMKDFVVNNTLYTQFHPCKAEDGGTVTGRLSSSHPNLQNSPANDLEIGKTIRELFIPFLGHKWGRIDYSQIDVRLIAHYAVGERANEIREAFNHDNDVDFHQWCADEADITRKKAKSINFGIFYGMGVELLCKKLNISREEGEQFLAMYFNKLPFIKKTIRVAKNKAETRGYVKTILGRRRRFPIKDFSYKAINAIIQGSAADVMKKSMVDSWKAGIYNILIPLLTVHDEIDVSIPQTKEGTEAFKELGDIMENTIKLKVPIIVDMEIGDNWGSLEKCK